MRKWANNPYEKKVKNMLKDNLLKSLKMICPNGESYKNLLCSVMDKYSVLGLRDLTYQELKEAYKEQLLKNKYYR